MKLKSLTLTVISGLLISSLSSCWMKPQYNQSLTFNQQVLEAVQKQPTANQKINKLFERHQEYNMRTFPTWATNMGDHRFDDRLSNLSDKAEQAIYQQWSFFLKLLNTIDFNSLTPENQINYELFKSKLESSLASQPFNMHYMPIAQQSGIHIYFPQIINSQPLFSYRDYQKYFSRLRGFKIQVDQVIANMKLGLNSGIVMPRFIMEKTLTQMQNIIDTPVKKSPFYQPLSKKNGLNPMQKVDVRKELERVIEQDIIKAYKKLHFFVKNEYLPKSSKHAGIWRIPNGEKYYQYAIKHHTGLNLSANEIHQIGLNEVNRIRSEMKTVKNKIGFKGNLEQFHNHLRTHPQFYFTKKEDLMQGYRKILAIMDAKLPELFGILPKAPYDLKEMESYRAKSAPQAYYYSAPEDRSRPGYFYVNTYKLASRPKYTMTALALHEAVPGHHLQIAIAQEREKLPFFRKYMGISAFTEGWGLYAEHLGYESGMYTDLYQHYGALTFEMWRACRLVVDTGIHSKRWTRQQGFEFMKKYTPNSELDIRSEVDRYIAWPGQALAYKLGELKLKELRKRAEDKLGKDFNIRAFHDQVLQNGSIPLPLLEKKINQWLASK